MTDAQMNAIHRQRAAEIVGSMSDTGLQEALKRDIALNLARAEDAGYTQASRDLERGRIRVVRLLEYVYPDAKSALDDQQHWQVQGVYRPSAGRLIRSTVLPMEVLD